jgi:hypothetical protein
MPIQRVRGFGATQFRKFVDDAQPALRVRGWGGQQWKEHVHAGTGRLRGSNAEAWKQWINTPD